MIQTPGEQTARSLSGRGLQRPNMKDQRGCRPSIGEHRGQGTEEKPLLIWTEEQQEEEMMAGSHFLSTFSSQVRTSKQGSSSHWRRFHPNLCEETWSRVWTCRWPYPTWWVQTTSGHSKRKDNKSWTAEEQCCWDYSLKSNLIASSTTLFHKWSITKYFPQEKTKNFLKVFQL